MHGVGVRLPRKQPVLQQPAWPLVLARVVQQPGVFSICAE